MKLRRKLWLGAGVLALLLPFLFLAEEHFRGKWELQHWRAHLIAQGEKFDTDRLSPVPADPAENGLPDLMWAGGELQANPHLSELKPATLRFTAPGKAVAAIRQPQWVAAIYGGTRTRNSTSNVNWRILGDELAKIAEPLNDVRAALKKSSFDGRLNYRDGFSLLLPHLARMKSIAGYLSAASLQELHEGQLDKALDDLEALLSLACCQQPEPLVISQLVRIAIATIGFQTTWQALQAPGWTDPQLARLQAAWARAEFIGAMGRSLEMERAMGAIMFENARRSAREADALLTGSAPVGSSSPAAISSMDELVEYMSNDFPNLFRKSLGVPLWQFAWSHQDELNYGQIMQAMIEADRQAAKLRSGLGVSALAKELELREQKMSVYARLRFAGSVQAAASLSRGSERAVRCETLREMVVAAVALKRHESAHRSLPPDLGALVPEFLPGLPVDYMDGQPLRYRSGTIGVFLLYSVGDNRVDDGGDPTPVMASVGAVNLLNGRDIVWPTPASPEEVSEDEKRRKIGGR